MQNIEATRSQGDTQMAHDRSATVLAARKKLHIMKQVKGGQPANIRDRVMNAAKACDRYFEATTDEGRERALKSLARWLTEIERERKKPSPRPRGLQ